MAARPLTSSQQKSLSWFQGLSDPVGNPVQCQFIAQTM